MRAVIQRSNWCKVTSEGVPAGEIKKGLTVFLGVRKGDTEKDALYIADKILNLRVFEDDNDRLNFSVKDVNGEIMIISQFTLYGDCRHGRRPSFTDAEEPKTANDLYGRVVELCRESGLKIRTGKFQTYMQVVLENDGPVTILLDSDKLF